jgi:iron complex transport system ATP-binding protein
MTSLLSAHNLTYHASDSAPLLHNIDLHLHAGEVIGILGPNGAGKSTLLKLLAGLRVPTHGEVLLHNQPILAVPTLKRATTVGYLEQRPQLHWPYTVQQVVELGRLSHAKQADSSTQSVAMEALAMFGVGALASRQFASLSEGEKLLVQLARILACAKQVLLFDEPTAALDPAQQRFVLRTLRKQASHGTGVLVVLHDLSLAAQFCDRLLLLQQGRSIATGAAVDVLTPALLQQVYQINAKFDTTTHTVVISD